MNLQRKTFVMMACMAGLCACGILVFVYYVIGHPGSVPRSAIWLLLSWYILVFGVGMPIASRIIKREVAIRTTTERDKRISWGSKALKLAIVFYGLALLNGIRLVLQHEVPWKPAIVGVTVDIVLIAGFWISLKRLKRYGSSKPAAGSNQTV